MEALIGLWLLMGFFWGLVAAMIGSPKGQTGTGFLIGLFFGPFGVLIMLFTTGSRRECPYCRELVKEAATVCPHCQREIGQAVPRQRKTSQAQLKSDLDKFRHK